MPQPRSRLDLRPAPIPTPSTRTCSRYFPRFCMDKLGIGAERAAHLFAQTRTSCAPSHSLLTTRLMLAPSGLSKLEREMVAVVVSSANRCFYCLVDHGQAVRALSV